MSDNPYATPAASVSKSDSSVSTLYSPNQAAIGALLGGPVGLIFFIRQNFVALNNESGAKKSLMFGALLILSLIIILPLLPDKFPSAPINVLYIFAGRGIVNQYQMTKQNIIDSAEYSFKSNWNVLGMGLVSLIGSIIIIVVPLMLLSSAGLIHI